LPLSRRGFILPANQLDGNSCRSQPPSPAPARQFVCARGAPPRPVPDADALARLCKALEIRIVPTKRRPRENETTAAGTLQNILSKYGAAHFAMTIRTIVETKGHARALVEPVIYAVSDVMLAQPSWPNTGSDWLTAFDGIDLLSLQRMARPLFAISKLPARAAIGGMLVQRLAPIFSPPKVKPPRKVPPAPKPGTALKAIEQGLVLLAVKGPHANSPISHQAHKLSLYGTDIAQVQLAARLYGDRPELVARLSRDALFVLCSARTPPVVRAAVEAKLAAGHAVKASTIRKMRR
jgi:hypothetical protein